MACRASLFQLLVMQLKAPNQHNSYEFDSSSELRTSWNEPYGRMLSLSSFSQYRMYVCMGFLFQFQHVLAIKNVCLYVCVHVCVCVWKRQERGHPVGPVILHAQQAPFSWPLRFARWEKPTSYSRFLAQTLARFPFVELMLHFWGTRDAERERE